MDFIFSLGFNSKLSLFCSSCFNLGALSGWFLCPFYVPFIFFLSTVVPADAPGSSCIFPTPGLESISSQRSPDSFY